MQRIVIALLCFLSSLAPTACAGEEPVASAPGAEPSGGAPTERRALPPPAESARLRFGFDDDPVGAVPRGFQPAHTGRGATGRWEVVAAPGAPSPTRAVAQLDPDRTGYRFPLLVLDAPLARDVELSVAAKPISGAVDQAIGLVWRYRDPENYYVVRANALEDNVVLYKLERGERSDLPLVGKGRTYGADIDVPEGSWSRLRVRAIGNRFTVFLGDRELFAVEDDTFRDPGRVGLWTKADSVTWFDDLEVVVFDPPAAGVDAAVPGE